MSSFKLWLIGGFVLFCLTSAAGIALMALSGWFISAAAFAGLSAITAANFNYLLPGAGVRLFAFIRILSRYGERLLNHQATFKIIANIRTWLFTKLAKLSPLQLTIIKNGSLLNRFISDVESLDNLFLRVLTPFFSSLILLALITLMLSFFNTVIALITCLITVAMLIILSWLMLTLGRKSSAEYHIALSQLRESITFSCEAIKEITIFNAIDKQIEYIDKILKLISNKQQKIALASGLAQALIVLSSGFVAVIALIVALHASLDHHLNGAYIAFIVLAIFAFYELLQPLPMAFLSLGQTEQSAKNITALTDINPLFTAPEKAIFQPNHYEIIIKNLSFIYQNNSNKALDNFSLQLPYGQHAILTGASGSGKTTLVNLFARFIKPSDGFILVDNHSLNMLTEKQWQKIFCIIPQQPHLFDTTLRDNLLLAKPNATDDELWSALEICQLKNVITKLPHGLDTYVGKNGEHLSGGQAKRVALTRAVLKNTPVTILDEPTEGLDVETERKMIVALKHFFQNKTLLIASHRPETIKLFNMVIKF